LGFSFGVCRVGFLLGRSVIHPFLSSSFLITIHQIHPSTMLPRGYNRVNRRWRTPLHPVRPSIPFRELLGTRIKTPCLVDGPSHGLWGPFGPPQDILPPLGSHADWMLGDVGIDNKDTTTGCSNVLDSYVCVWAADDGLFW